MVQREDASQWWRKELQRKLSEAKKWKGEVDPVLNFRAMADMAAGGESSDGNWLEPSGA